MHEFSAIIDIRGHTVTFSGDNIVSFVTGDRPPVVSDVLVSTTCVIEAQSEVIIPAYLSKYPGVDTVVGLIEAVPKLADRYHLCGASTLTSPSSNGAVSFGLLNPSNTPVVLHKGTIVGYFVEIGPDTEISALDISSLDLHSTSCKDAFL